MTEEELKSHMQRCNQCRGYAIHLYKRPCVEMEKHLQDEEKKRAAQNR